jgi:hypothetical protein
LDSAVNVSEVQAQRSIIDELCEDGIIDVFNSLLHIIKLCSMKLKLGVLPSCEDSAVLNDVILKVAAAAEIFAGTKGIKHSLKEFIVINNPCIR